MTNTPPNAVLSTSSEHSTSAGIRETARVIGMEMFMIYRRHRCNYCRSSVGANKQKVPYPAEDLLQRTARMLHRRMSQFGPSPTYCDVAIRGKADVTRISRKVR
jgi:hypothetical protein